MYVLYNYIFFRKINRKYATFSDDSLLQIRFDTEPDVQQASFPMVKIFLSKLNFLFNNDLQVPFLSFFEDIRKLAVLAKSLENRQGPPYENFFYVSCLFGCYFYNLSHSEQNNFHPIEVQSAYLIHSAIVNLYLKNFSEFNASIADLKACYA